MNPLEAFPLVNFLDYRLEAAKTDFELPNEPNPIGKVAYHALQIAAEAGEVAGKVSKYYRDREGFDIATEDGQVRSAVQDTAFEHDVALELGDVLWHLDRLAAAVGYSVSEIAEMNISKIRDRQQRNVLRGSGDHR